MLLLPTLSEDSEFNRPWLGICCVR